VHCAGAAFLCPAFYNLAVLGLHFRRLVGIGGQADLNRPAAHVAVNNNDLPVFLCVGKKLIGFAAVWAGKDQFPAARIHGQSSPR